MEFYCRGVKNIFIKDSIYSCVIFCGCDFRCAYCYNQSILNFKNEFLTRIIDIKKIIKQSQNLGVIFAGAEPCLQRQALLNLARFCKKLRKKTILHTNGSKPETINSLLRENLIDKLHLDIKSPFNNSFQKITKSATYFKSSEEIIKSIRKTITLLKNSKSEITVRTTIVPKLIYRKEDILKIAEIVEDINCEWELRQFIPGDTLDKKLKGVKPLSDNFLETLKKICEKEHSDLKITTC
ncbi:4Fe-4S cluster-binding domain-containing protein [Candidatus Woesearchaeota archaeon]|nr:4Fe-4S cluster-binding domain-containing protein [Candidatus Woesearchaeota archaeon]